MFYLNIAYYQGFYNFRIGDMILKNYLLKYKHYFLLSNSIQKSYVMSYYLLKKVDSRDKQLKVIINRLEKQLKPM